MKKYILTSAYCLLQLAISLSSQAQNCPTFLSKTALGNFQTAVLNAKVDSTINRRVFSYDKKIWYMDPLYWNEFEQTHREKRARSILESIKFDKQAIYKNQPNKVHCFYTQTRENPYLPNHPITLEFRMSYLTK